MALKAAGCSVIREEKKYETAATGALNLKRFSLSCAKACTG